MLLSSEIARKVLTRALERGASFAELYIERDDRQVASILSSKVHQLTSGIDFGIGVRLLFGSEVFYGYTNTPTLEELNELVDRLALQKGKTTSLAQTLILKNPPTPTHVLAALKKPSANLHAPIEYMTAIDQEVRKLGSNLAQVQVSLLNRFQEVEIFNSEGLHVIDQRPYLRFMVQAIVEAEGEQSTGYEGPGIMGQFEDYQKLYDPKALAQKVYKQAMATLKAPYCPAGKMPVVMANAFGGVIFHEACGHLLETTSVQKKASVFHDKMGEMIAHPVVNAVDEGLLPGKWGSVSFDDEGTPTQKTQLIKNGVLNSFLVDRVGSLKTGYALTGSGRRQNYRFAPASRMRNTYIEAGKDQFSEMIASIDKGLYCASMGGGSVSPGTGEFNFAATESYMIEKGKITHAVKGATLIGTGPEVLKQISMVGSDLELSAGMCGSVSGSIPTTVGQPALKINEILVGGRA